MNGTDAERGDTTPGSTGDRVTGYKKKIKRVRNESNTSLTTNYNRRAANASKETHITSKLCKAIIYKQRTINKKQMQAVKQQIIQCKGGCKQKDNKQEIRASRRYKKL